MPTTRHRRINPRRSVLGRTRTADYLMVTGHDVFNIFHGDLDAMTGYWQAHRVAILAEHAVKCPGTRPWFWWLVEAPVPREIANAAPAEVEQRWRVARSFRGVFVPFSNILHGHGPKDELVPWLEPEADYLERTGFLSVSEAEALDNPDVVESDGTISVSDIEPIEDDHLAGDDEPGHPATDVTD
jgi:hypothetical protein